MRKRAVGARSNDGGSDVRQRLLARLGMTERRLELAGVPTASLEGGDGPPVIFLHEQGEFGAAWQRVLPALAATHRVIAPDLPGHGASGTPQDGLGADVVSAWLSQLVEATCSEPPALVGHMLGGAIAARFAARHSDEIGHLVLVDSFGLRRFIPSPAFAAALIPYLARPSERSHDRLHRYCMVDLDGVQAEMGDDWAAFRAYALDRLRSPSVRVALRSMMLKLGVPRIPPADLARISAPTTLIWGRHDPVTPLRVARAASARYGWSLRVIEDAGDMPAMEAPESFVGVLRSTLGREPDDGRVEERGGRAGDRAR